MAAAAMHSTLPPRPAEAGSDTVSSELVRHLSHELNDSLGAVESLVYLAEKKAGESEEVRRYLLEIPRLVEKASRAVQGAAHCVGALPAHPERLDLNVLVAEAAAAAYSPRGPALLVDLSAGELPVQIDPAHAAFLLASVIECFQSLGRRCKQILVRTARDAGSSAEVVLECAEHHMEQEIARLCEPFRPLAAARSVVQANGGRLTACCSANPGTLLRISLPIAR
ncbi:MAG: hypothetical protein R2729_12005 [Bryobacteraceae bacterium]